MQKKGNYAFETSAVGIRTNNVTVTVLPSSLNQKITVDCPDVISFRDDQTVEVNVSLINNQGLMGCKLNIGYDPTVLEPISADALFSGAADNNIGLNADNFDVIWYAENENNTDGEFLNIEFRVISTAFETSSVEITYSPESTFDEEYNLVELECSPMQVMVNALAGDVDMNGVVDANDVGLVMLTSVSSNDLTKSQSLIADVNKDGVVDAFDASMIDRLIYKS